jgi:hypothetical protein
MWIDVEIGNLTPSQRQSFITESMGKIQQEKEQRNRTEVIDSDESDDTRMESLI